jgi:hypothetical protein
VFGTKRNKGDLVNNKTIIILCLVSATAASALTHFYFPTVKTVEVEKEVIRNNIQTVTHTVKQPNGAIDITTTTTDHSQTVLTDTKKEYNVNRDWVISAFAETSIKLDSPSYGLQVQRRVLGPVFIGGLVNNKGNIGVSLGMEF